MSIIGWFDLKFDAWQTSAAEISQQGSPAVSSTRVRITGNPKREVIFIPMGFLANGHAHSRPNRQVKIRSRVHWSVSFHRQARRNASERRRAARCYARGARQERTQRSSSFCPTHMREPQQGATFFFLRAFTFFHSLLRSTGAFGNSRRRSFDVKSARLP